MAQSITTYLYNPPGSSDLDLAPSVEGQRGVRIVGRFTNWFDLQRALTAQLPSLVCVNLDGLATSQFILIRNILEVSPTLPVLGFSTSRDGDTVIAAMRAGCRQFIPCPADPHDLDAALSSIRAADQSGTSSHCIAVLGAGGGAGATTIATNLVVEIAALVQKRCAIVDMDLLLGDTACVYDASPEHSIADVCRSGAEIDQTVIERAMCELPFDVSLLARPEQPREFQDITPEAIERLFGILGQIFPYVVIDLPLSMTPVTLAALGCSDRVLIVTQLSVPHLRNSDRLRRYITQLGADASKIEFVLNRGNAAHEMVGIKGAEEHFQKPFFGTIPNDYRLVRSSHDLGHPLMTNVPNSHVRLAIEAIAKRIVFGDAAESKPKKEEAKAKSGGLLSAFLPRSAKAGK